MHPVFRAVFLTRIGLCHAQIRVGLLNHVVQGFAGGGVGWNAFAYSALSSHKLSSTPHGGLLICFLFSARATLVVVDYEQRFTEEQSISVMKRQEVAQRSAGLFGMHRISNAMFFNWKAKYGSMEVSEAKQLRVLAEEMCDVVALR